MTSSAAESILSEIIVYPLKGAQGVKKKAWPLLTSGLLNDRQWMLVARNGKCVTQLTMSKSSLVKTELHRECVVFSAPGLTPVRCEFNAHDTSRELEVSMEEGGKSKAKLVNETMDKWFSSFLGMECRMVHCSEESDRMVDGSAEPLQFQKAFPLHLASEASLAELNSRLDVPVEMNRFRPNLIIRGTGPHEDDRWKRIQIGGVILQIVRACDHRCGVPNIEQETGQMGTEPLKTLSRYRKSQQGIYFGQNVVIERPGSIRAEDRIKVLEYGSGLLGRGLAEKDR